MRTSPHRFKVLMLLVLLLASACQTLRERREEKEAPLVRVEAVKPGTMPRVLSLPASVRAVRKATVNPEASGRVQRVGVEEGDHVAEGEPVVWLHPGLLESQVREQVAQVDSARSRVRQMQASLATTSGQVDDDIKQATQKLRQAEIGVSQAKTELASAKNDLDRKTNLYGEKAIAKSELESAQLQWEISGDELKTAESQLQAAKDSLQAARQGRTQVDGQRAQFEGAQADLRGAVASLESTREQLEHTILRAPIRGVVVARNVNPGQSVGPGGDPLLSLTDNTRLEVLAQIDERYTSSVRPGMEAELTTALHPGKTFLARIREVVPASNPQTNTVSAIFQFPDPPEGLVDGAVVQMRLLLELRPGMLVPLTAVHKTSVGATYVWVVTHDTAYQRLVTIVTQNEVHVLVSPGEMKDGEQVVVAGGASLEEGSLIKVDTGEQG